MPRSALKNLCCDALDVFLPDFLSKSAQWETIINFTFDCVVVSDISNVSIFPEYNSIGSAIIELFESSNPRYISTLSFTIFSLRQVDINVWSAPDSDKLRDVLDISVCSSNDEPPTKCGEAVYVLLEPDTDEVKSNPQSVKKTGVEKPISTRCIGLIWPVNNSFFTDVVSVRAIVLVITSCYAFCTF